MVIEATCMDCGQTFRYNRIRKPKEPMKRCPKCARKHYASKYLAKHRVDMLVKALRKVQAYCAEHPRGCRGCALLNLWGGCKLRSCPTDWGLDDVGYFSEGTSTSGKGGSKP